MTGTPSSPQELNQAQANFYLPIRFEDPFGNVGTITYDAYNLLVTSTSNALQNTVSAVSDYRVLAPNTVTDPNGNRAQVTFDTLGMVAETAVMGKTTEKLGDLLTGIGDTTHTQVDAFYDAADPHPVATGLLGSATTRIVYDVRRFYNSKQAAPNDPTQWLPAFAATLARETHYYDLAGGQTSKIQISFSYSDGFGREIEKKVQAEPGPVNDGGPTVTPRWVGNGWTIFNNKGKPVRQYEPFFSQLAKGHQFEFGTQVGVSPIFCYDPVDRVVTTIHPNHSYEKVVFDPWTQQIWDVNDTVLQTDPTTDPDVPDFFKRLPIVDYMPTWYAQRSGGSLGTLEEDAATKAAAHANTPAVAYFDTLGRSFLAIADNGSSGKYPTRVELDIQGNQRSVRDAIVQAGDQLGRVVMRYDYDLLKNRIHQASMEAGERWTLKDCTGKPIRDWDTRGHNFRTEYDALRRPTGIYVLGTDSANSDPRTTTGEVLIEKTTFGESQLSPETLNLRTRIFQHADTAGIMSSTGKNPITNQDEGFDFKGNPLRSTRALVADYKALPNWSSPPATVETFMSSTQYDAVNRPIDLTTPDGSVVHATYNEANLLEAVNVNLRGAVLVTSFVTNIAYNAKGQRLMINYGNATSTAYIYDPLTFRLVRILTTRSGFPTNNQTVQDLNHTFDPAGNITHIQDNAQQTIFFANKRVEPSNDFFYDAIYRLIQATGREHFSASVLTPTSYSDVPRVNVQPPDNGTAMGVYQETYNYDAVGNFTSFIHKGTDPSNPGWTRSYNYNEQSLLESGKVNNRLSSSAVSGSTALTEPYTHDLHGDMTSMLHLQAMQWDYKDELHMTQRQAVNTSDTDGIAHQGQRTYYVYDAAGQRVRKATESAAGKIIKERLYLGGFELYREFDGTGNITLARETVHVMDDKKRVALVETKTIDSNVSPISLPSATTRYQFDNHLGTACLELDEYADVITYEEYYPYGSTSYQAGRTLAEVSLKRYRYTGKERDEETGFTYHGARYYAPWMGRWTSCDSQVSEDGLNRYQYVRANPVRLFDDNGRWGTEMHFAAVYWSGRLAGASHDQALFAAIASQSLDDFESTAAPDQKMLALQRQYLQPLITGSSTQLGPTVVNTGGTLSPNVQAMRFGDVAHALGAPNRVAAELAVKRGIQIHNLITFGLGLHTAGDFLAHANQTGTPTVGHQEGRNEDLSQSHWYSRDADHTNQNPMKALATFVRFTELWAEYNSKATPGFSPTVLEQLSKFIFSGYEDDETERWNAMISALKTGLTTAGAKPTEIEKVVSLMDNKEERRRAYLSITSAEFNKAGESEAFRTWLSVPYDAAQSNKKIDIRPYVTGLPDMPTDPRFEQAKRVNAGCPL